jgi:hypothetical protein
VHAAYSREAGAAVSDVGKASGGRVGDRRAPDQSHLAEEFLDRRPIMWLLLISAETLSKAADILLNIMYIIGARQEGAATPRIRRSRQRRNLRRQRSEIEQKFTASTMTGQHSFRAQTVRLSRSFLPT